MTVFSAKDEIVRMARYHAWATERLLSAVAVVPDEAYRQSCGLYFGSIHGTLNHLALADGEIWYPRFTGKRSASLSLDAELESDRAALTSRLLAATARWPRYIENLDEAALAGDLRYTMTTGQARVLPVAAALFHVFNHGTHHRGQVTAALSMLGFDYPPLDLPFMIFAEA